MKKLIAVFILFTLLATAAFAEVEVGAEIKGSWYVLEGAKGKGPKGDDLKPTPWTSSTWAGDSHNIRGRATVTAITEEETLGGWLEVQALPGPAGRGNVWWQPATPFKATMGYIWGDANMVGDIVTVDDDLLPVKYFGRFDSDRYTEWTSRVIHGWGWESEDAAATIELRPVENLYFVATVPLVQWDGKFVLGRDVEEGKDIPAGDIFAQTAARLAYTIGDVGQFAINWDGGTMTTIEEGEYDPAFIGAHFNLLAVENLEASIGFEFPLPIKKYHRNYDGGPATKPKDLEKTNGKFTQQLPLGLDLRANFTASDFNLGFGLAAYFAGNTKAEKGKKMETAYEEPFEFGITLNPSYDFGALKAGLVGEVGFQAEHNKKYKDMDGYRKDSVISYNIIPYVQKDISAGSVYAGVQIDGSSAKDDIHYAIPIGFVVSF